MFTQHAHNRWDTTVRRLAMGAAVLTALVLATAGTALAGSDERKGTGGANELRLGVGPRGSALGGSIVAEASGVEALFWNPAGLANLERTEAMFTHQEFFADMDLNYAAVATNIAGFGTIAFNAKVLSIGDVIVTTEQAPEGTGEILEPTFSVLGVSYARRFTDRVLFGGTLNYVNEKVANATAQGLAVDFGVQYITGWRGLKFGLAMKNFGPSMEFGGEDFELNIRPPDSDPTAANRTFRTTSAEFEMPSYFQLGAAYDLWSRSENRLAVLGSFQSNNFLGDYMQGGAEWSYKDVVSVRGSYFGSFESRIDPLSGDSESDIRGGDDLYEGLALGAGVRLPLGSNRLGVDIAWRDVQGFFDDSVEVAAKMGF